MNFKDLSIRQYLNHISGQEEIQEIKTAITDTDIIKKYLEYKTDSYSKDKFDDVIKLIRDYAKQIQIEFYDVEDDLPDNHYYAGRDISDRIGKRRPALKFEFNEYDSLRERINFILNHPLLKLPFDCRKLLDFSDIAEQEYKRVCGQKDEVEEKDKVVEYGKLQYDQDTLSILHAIFNADGKLWESIDINEFYNNFKEIPARTITLKNDVAFSYLMRTFYDSARLFNSDIKDWYKEHFNIANVTKHKNRKTYDERIKDSNEGSFNKKTKEDDLIDYINNKLKPI